jgi:hypothetical protein
MSAMTAWIWPIFLAIAAWFSLEFIGKPFLRFQEMRSNVLRATLRGTLGSFVSITTGDGREELISANRENALRFKTEMADLAVSLLAFTETEYLASKALRLLGYEIESAAHSAVGLSITRLPDGAFPIGAGSDKFEILEGILRESLRLSVPPAIAEKLRLDWESYLEKTLAEEGPGAET